MAHTYRANEFNSTPFSSCCGAASMDSNGRPAKKCARCGEEITHDINGLPARRPGYCLMCGKPYKNGPQDAGACHC